MTSLPTILLVEGRKPAAEYLHPLLDDRYEILTARTRRDALALLREEPPAAIVLDRPSLRFSTRRFCHTLQDDEIEIPVLILIEEGEEIDRTDGARAHLRYPFSVKKLANRIERMLPAPESEVIEWKGLLLNLEHQYVVSNGRETHLTPKQAHLLEVFMRHPGEILTRAFLMRQVWDTDFVGDTRTLEVHIHWVRKAIEKNPGSPTYLRTVRGVGYRFDTPEEKT